jgi:hypothetical protein
VAAIDPPALFQKEIHRAFPVFLRAAIFAPQSPSMATVWPLPPPDVMLMKGLIKQVDARFPAEYLGFRAAAN